ncbi:beta-L-arabinofuranosidase domain-containing protein [Lacticaseibacillus mingshuiensis]|uniref:Beta-L-arabinofuranosidase domain-containing protein n=1 Tax=Lacticaseibacillus mingshuiensis TaxID=2799574 RepID=A0ABW4CGV1_9LACO|nr:beta-L-arabinofuranosidase domain-containing protein [Lacticaseibacillus mingshuiensis]
MTTTLHDAARFTHLPLGAIHPAGWLQDQLRIQANGLTGGLEDHWDDVKNSAWKGGNGEDWERGPYYLDGLVPLAYLLNDEKLIAKAQPWLEWILNSQREDGQFGPTTNDDWWPRMVALKVLIQYQEATGDARVVPLMTKYAHYHLAHAEAQPLTDWGEARGWDEIMSLLWLYGKTQDDQLLDLIAILRNQTADWADLYKNFPFRRYTRFFSHQNHVVNVAMSLKSYALAYELDGDAQAKADFENAWATLQTYHGQLHGLFSGDEWLSGTDPTQGTELCSIVEAMFSFETLTAVFGDSSLGDRLERLAFNALPATISRDWTAHQYDQQVNQVRADVAHRNWTQNDDHANTFGLEPHFGCCLANMHQGWPKFVASTWLKDRDGLVCISPVPATVQDGARRIDVTSNYPFTLGAGFAVTTDAPFTLKLRVPTWATGTTLTVNDEAQLLTPQDGYLALTVQDGDQLTLAFAAEVRFAPRANRATGVLYGPLLFALPIKEHWQRLFGNQPYPDFGLTPESEWRYGLSTHAKFDVVENSAAALVNGQVFDSLHSPISIRTTGWRLNNWDMRGNSADEPPYNVDAGEATALELVPYGGAKLRIVEFPTIDPRP